MTADDNVARMHRVMQGWNAQDPVSIDEFYAPDFVSRTPQRGVSPDREGFRQRVAQTAGAFPDFQLIVDDVLASGDSVVCRWTFVGTNTGSFAGMPATGASVRFGGVTVDRMVDGKAVEEWEYSDQMALLQQLGLMPGAEAPA
ncbi:MAG TPA: ester cyclase [Chloroflexota bacterium]